MKTIIIDGNNLIHKIPVLKSLFLKDKTCAQISLIEKIKTINKGLNKVVIVFDGYGEDKGNFRFKDFDVYYSKNDTADNVIKEIITNFGNFNLLKVVSSDNEITGFARICGYEIQDSENFRDTYFNEKSPAKNKNINQNFIYDKPEKPEGSNKKDFEEFKRLFS